jgi:hypothetical protein
LRTLPDLELAMGRKKGGARKDTEWSDNEDDTAVAAAPVRRKDKSGRKANAGSAAAAARGGDDDDDDGGGDGDGGPIVGGGATDTVEDSSPAVRRQAAADGRQKAKKGGKKGDAPPEDDDDNDDDPQDVAGGGGSGGGGVKCFKCGESGHITAKCPQKGAKAAARRKCYVCGLPGHTRRECPGVDDGGVGQSRFKNAKSCEFNAMACNTTRITNTSAFPVTSHSPLGACLSIIALPLIASALPSPCLFFSRAHAPTHVDAPLFRHQHTMYINHT